MGRGFSLVVFVPLGLTVDTITRKLQHDKASRP
jgi:hypothetical protein